MSTRSSPSAAEILARYAAGYFPLYDPDNRFYWERLPIRAMIPLTPEVARRAAKLAQRPRKKFKIRHTTAVGRVIAHLRDAKVKPRTWVRREVVAIYRTLERAGLLQTVEAYDARTGDLAGALLGIVLPGCFIAETMFSLVPDASKFCLCQLVIDARVAGHRLIDVQTPHDLDELSGFDVPHHSADKTPHPCIRLGERTVSLSMFARLFKAAISETFTGTLQDWLDTAAALAQATRSPDDAPALLAAIDPAHLRAAWPMLQHNFPDTLRPAIRD